MSNTYLGEFLAQLQQEGYSIFIVKGNVSFCLFKKEILKGTLRPDWICM